MVKRIYSDPGARLKKFGSRLDAAKPDGRMLVFQQPAHLEMVVAFVSRE